MDNKLIDNRWSRWTIYLLLGILIKFLLDVSYSLAYRNYPLFQPIGDYALTILLTFVTLESVYLVRKFLEKKIQWDDAPYRRFYLQFGFSLLVTLGFVFGIRWAIVSLFSTFTYVRLFDEIIILVVAFIVVLTMVIIELGFFLLNKWRFSLAELERFKKANAEYQFESLRSQVNPHFLFNSLNTLSSLIYESQEKAESFVRELSDVYRYILENRGRDLVSLKEEINMARSYIYLVHIRFEKNLEIRLDVDSSHENHRIPPLTLQLLIENAVKHNIISQKKPLTVEIGIVGGKLIVKNNLQKKITEEYSSKTGLKNIQSRYDFLTKEQIDVTETESEFIVTIPLIQPL
jgi:sensor histidine kinase YesM